MVDPGLVIEAAVAYLTAEGLTQAEIGKILGISQSAVSRLMSEAEKKYLEKPRFKREALAPDLLEDVMRAVGRRELLTSLDRLARAHGNRRGPVVRVFPLTGDREEQSLAVRFREFTRQAAPYIHSLINRPSVRLCGVTWGYMLFDLVNALRGIQAAWKVEPVSLKSEQVQVIPLSGDPFKERKEEPPSLTSSNIAAELGRVLNGDSYRAHWLGPVPAFIPEEFDTPSARKVIERWIQLVPDYEEIFGDGSEANTGLANHLDMLLTSVGTADNPLGFGKGRLLNSLGTQMQNLREEIYGDVGGIVLPRSSEPSKLVQTITNRWKGIRYSHMARCARRADDDEHYSGRPGVVILSVGKERAEVIAAAVAQGLVNHLVIDQELAEELERIVKPMLPPNP
jgi:DNA-binding transcriptional regulator LsrR (DeoR family)